MDFVNEIKERITAREVLERYGYPVNARGYTCCPFHNEKTASLRAYDGQGGYHCFGCGIGGDVIDLARRILDCDFKTTLSRLNSDFKLGLPIDCKLTYEEQKASILAEIRRKEAAKKRKQQEERLKNEYNKALDEYIRLDNNMRIYKPKEWCEELPPLFLEALHRLPIASQRLDEAERGLRELWKTE